MIKAKGETFKIFSDEAVCPFVYDDEIWMTVKGYLLSKMYRTTINRPYEVLNYVVPTFKHLIIDGRLIKVPVARNPVPIPKAVYEEAVRAKLAHPMITGILDKTRNVTFDNPVVNAVVTQLKENKTREIAKLKIIDITSIDKSDFVLIGKLLRGMKSKGKSYKKQKLLTKFFRNHLPNFHKKYIVGWFSLIDWDYIFDESPNTVEVVTKLARKINVDFNVAMILILLVYYSKRNKKNTLEVQILLENFPEKEEPSPPSDEGEEEGEPKESESASVEESPDNEENKSQTEITKIENIEVSEKVPEKDPPPEEEFGTRRELKKDKTIWGFITNSKYNPYIQDQNTIVPGDTYFVDGDQVFIIYTFDPNNISSLKESLMKTDIVGFDLKIVRFLEENLLSVPFIPNSNYDSVKFVIEETFDTIKLKYKFLPYVDGGVKTYIPAPNQIKRIGFKSRILNSKANRNIVYASLFSEQSGEDKKRLSSILEGKNQKDVILFINDFVKKPPEERKSILRGI